MILPEIYDSLSDNKCTTTLNREYEQVNPKQDDNWQYMQHAGRTFDRHQNHVIVNPDGVVAWAEFTMRCKEKNVDYIRTSLEQTCNDLVDIGLTAKHLHEDSIAEEAFETLTLSLATISQTVVHEMNAQVEDCVFMRLVPLAGCSSKCDQLCFGGSFSEQRNE